MTYKVTRSQEYLEHHGIEGQKWGKRNGPPYPLKYDDHTGLEKKYNRKDELSKYDIKTDKHGPGASRYLSKQIMNFKKQYDSAFNAKRSDLDDSEDYELDQLNKNKSSMSEEEYEKKVYELTKKYDERRTALAIEKHNASVELAERTKAKIMAEYGDKGYQSLIKYDERERTRRKMVPITIAAVGATAIIGGAIAYKAAERSKAERAWQTSFNNSKLGRSVLGRY